MKLDMRLNMYYFIYNNGKSSEQHTKEVIKLQEFLKEGQRTPKFSNI